jgi:hypothetical protein
LPENSTLTRLCRRLAHGLGSCAWPIIALGVAAAALSLYYTFTHLAFRTSRTALIGQQPHLAVVQEKLKREFGTHTDSMVVVVRNDDRRRALEFARALAGELQKYPREFPELFYRVDPEQFKKWALLYLEPEELRRLQNQLSGHRREIAALAADPSLFRFFATVNEEITRAMLGELFTPFLKEPEEPAKIPDLALLNATLKELNLSLAEGRPYRSPFASLFPGDLGDLSEAGYFFTDNKQYLLFLVTPISDGYELSTRVLKLLRQVVGEVKERFPGLEVGVTGPEPLEDDEMAGATQDITLATWLSLLSQVFLMVLFFRGLKRPLVQAGVLLFGLCWTLGAATLLVGHLNLLSIIFAPLMLGLTIDYGIHWYCRLEEEQGEPQVLTAQALYCTLKQATPAVFCAALAAVASFVPLMVTGFRGLAELGGILAAGVLLMTLATLVLLPALVIVTERCRPSPLAEECPGQPRPFLTLGGRRPRLTLALAVVVAALAGGSLLQVPFDLNPLHLQNPKTEAVVWELKLLQGSHFSTLYGAFTSPGLEDLEAKTRALKKLPTVSKVESILSFLPAEVPLKQQAVRELAPLVNSLRFSTPAASSLNPGELEELLGRIAFKLSQAGEQDWNPEDKPTQEQLNEVNFHLGRLRALLAAAEPPVAARLAAFQRQFLADLKDKWDLLRANVQAYSRPPTVQDLPPEVRKRFLSPGGVYLLEAFPSQDIWDPAHLHRFVQDLKSVDPEAGGDPVLLDTFTVAFRNACLQAAALALLAITMMLLILFRSLKLALLALVPLGVGTALTLNVMWLLGLSFNQANVLFLPLILGEGVEFGIIILVRWQMEEAARALTLPRATAKGVLLAALTTTVGFGSLMVSSHRGTFSLGLLAAVGSLCVLLASLVFLPAFLRLFAEGGAGSKKGRGGRRLRGETA